MKIENTATRLDYIMKERGIKQVDLLNLLKPYCVKYNVKMNKSDISQYLSDKAKPSQEKLVVLGMALNVTEAWLMGLDVPMTEKEFKNITEEEKQLLGNYNKLNDLGKNEAIKRVSELTEMTRYTYTVPLTIAAHNDELTEEENKIAFNRALELINKKKK